MTAAGTFPESYQEVCRVAIIDTDGNIINLDAFTEDITSMDFGEKDIEGRPLVNGGRVKKYTAMTDESITFKVYHVKADNATTDSIIQLFHPQSTPDITQPILVKNVYDRKEVGLVILMATTLPTTAVTLPGDSVTAYRYQIINANITMANPSFDDKILSAELTVKWAPFNKAGTENKVEESTNGSEYLPAATTSATSWT
jgi:hypothetical protein